jgi:hypothetical protein
MMAAPKDVPIIHTSHARPSLVTTQGRPKTEVAEQDPLRPRARSPLADEAVGVNASGDRGEEDG